MNSSIVRVWPISCGRRGNGRRRAILSRGSAFTGASIFQARDNDVATDGTIELQALAGVTDTEVMNNSTILVELTIGLV